MAKPHPALALITSRQSKAGDLTQSGRNIEHLCYLQPVMS